MDEIKCPICESKEVVFGQNFRISREYKVNKNGTISKRSTRCPSNEVADGFGYGYCRGCGEYLDIDYELSTGKVISLTERH